MKPNEVKLTLDIEQNRINSGGVVGHGGNVVFLQSPLIISSTDIPCPDQKTSSHQEVVTSPAAEALEFLTMEGGAQVQSGSDTIDPQNLLIDLNDLLRRDPTLSTLTNNLEHQPGGGLAITAQHQPQSNHAHQTHAQNHILQQQLPHHNQQPQYTQVKNGMDIPGAVQVKEEVGGGGGILDPGPKPVLLKIDEAQDLFANFTGGVINQAAHPVGSIATTVSSSLGNGGIMDNGSSFGSISPLAWSASGGGGAAGPNPMPPSIGGQLTLTQLNSPTDNDFAACPAPAPGSATAAEGSVKMEVSHDFDDLDQLFLTNSSPNVSFGLQETKPPVVTLNTTQFRPQQAQAQQQQAIKHPELGLGVSRPQHHQQQPSNYNPSIQLANPNFWQASTDELLFGTPTAGSSNSKDLFSTSAPGQAPALQQLSSSVGPTRHSTLHRLLMQRGKSDVAAAQAAAAQAAGQQGQQPGGGGHVTATKSRPSPVRSPEARKTLDQMRNSLSLSSGGISASMLSRSAPSGPGGVGPSSSLAAVSSGLNASANAAGGEPSRNMWARREPRPHINSVCSVGEASSIADEVNDVLQGLSPSCVDLQDIASDDEDDGAAGYIDDKDSSDDDSDTEGTSPSLAKLSTSAGSSRGAGGGKKTERNFWQYNVQAKGPKGQKIVIETKIEDPHVLNDIVDPVFSGDVQLQGIKHSGKARRGDGNDLTPNPRKLAAIGKELDQLSSVINGMTPVAEQPFGARCKSRKEKNKLASRACRLKKKAQHEANKVKCHGLLEEHRELSESIRQVKELLVKKMDINCTIPQPDLTADINTKVDKALSKVVVAGNTTKYVNDKIQEHLPYV